MKHQTLKLDGISRLPLWRGLALFSGFILGWMLLAELIARTPFGNHLPPPSVGADSFEFDLKVYYLEQSIRQNGPLDCLIVGDSMANSGLDPLSISQAYETQTGIPLHCFNFGMPALTLDASGPLALALSNRFHPQLLIFIVSARDFSIAVGQPFRHVATSDWVNHNLGQPSFRGWATNSLYGYRYFLFIQYWLNPANRKSFSDAYASITPQGFTPLFGFRTPPMELSPKKDFSVDASALQGFDQLLKMSKSGTSLLIVDAPLQDTFYQNAPGNPEAYMKSYESFMQSRSQALKIRYWATQDLSLTIPAEAWHDTLHVNEKGVPIFSAWLGQKLANNYPSDFFK